MNQSALYERYRYVARVVIETVTALSVTRGTEGRGFDTELVTDANGLPAIPGSALAGVLRHLYVETNDGQNTNAVFGYAEKTTQQASRVELSWAAVHDAHGRPIDALLIDERAWQTRLPTGRDAPERRDYSTLLRSLAVEPVVRDHVRLDECGVALLESGRGSKFDRSILPPGFRFTFELSLRAHEQDDATWDRLLGLLAHPAFRLGGGTRRGIGRVKVITIHQKRFDLEDAVERGEYLALPVALGEYGALARKEIPAPVDSGWERIELAWRPTQPWRIGGEDQARDPALAEFDLRPLREPAVSWDEVATTPRVTYRWVLPASSLKGALAHRVVYHSNRIESRWAGTSDPQKAPYDTLSCPAVRELFGYVEPRARGTGTPPQEAEPEPNRAASKLPPATARAGQVLMDDLPILSDGDDSVSYESAAHTSLDRWTGGVIDGALFDEAFLPALAQPRQFEWWVRTGLAESTRRAFAFAISDWLGGRLNVGAAGSRGFGFGEGAVTQWPTADGVRPASWPHGRAPAEGGGRD